MAGARRRRPMPGATFACPPDCGWCCTHLEREDTPDDDEFRAVLREQGIYHCTDRIGVGLSLSNAEASGLREEAARRGMAIDIHPRTFLLETRRRLVVPLDWHMPYVACPFYLDHKCTAYDLRPLVCRAFPVLGAAPRWHLAPPCPESAPTLARRDSGALRLGTFLRVENAARRAIDRQHALLDDQTMRLTMDGRYRFALGPTAVEASARAGRYRVATPESLLEEA